jgi:hypothetical protein
VQSRIALIKYGEACRKNNRKKAPEELCPEYVYSLVFSLQGFSSLKELLGRTAEGK